jgi:hypothetical protein
MCFILLLTVFSEASELEMAGFVLQKGADYIGHFGEQRSSLEGGDAKDVGALEAEYYILRTALVRMHSGGGIIRRRLS